VGPPRSAEQFPDVEIVATFHPAFCLRQADNFPSFVADIAKLNGEYATGWVEPDWKVFDDPAEAMLVIGELHQFEELVIDIECGIEKDTDFGHPEQYQMLCIGFAYAPNKAVVIGEEALKSRIVQNALADLFSTNKEWICQNGKFDLAGLSLYYPHMKLGFDTMLASYVLDERQRTHGLGYLSVEILGAPDWKHVVQPYLDKTKNYAHIPRDILYKYNAFDVACTWSLKDRFKQEMTEKQHELHQFLCRASDTLQLMEMEGIRVDVDHNAQLIIDYLAITEGLEKELKPWVDNPRSWMQVKKALKDQGFVVASTDKEHLELLLRKVSPDSETAKFIKMLLQYRKEQKLYSTYIQGFRSRIVKGRIHPSFLLHGTTTGRLSSRNPNMQNVPRASTPSGKLIRAQFIPDPGNIFVQADYAQIELRVMAVISQDEYLMGVFNDESRDIFDEVGFQLYGEDALGPNRKELRIRTKAYVYGVGYGREPYSVATEYDISVKEATRGMEAYFEMVPGLAKWRQDFLQQLMEEDDDLETVFGRLRRFHLITNDNKKDVMNQALAFIPQSTASDITLTALCSLREMGYMTRVPVHDSILVEDKIAHAEWTASKMAEVMSSTARDIMGDQVPFPVDIATGYNWGELG
jgi:DNA polymerase-1